MPTPRSRTVILRSGRGLNERVVVAGSGVDGAYPAIVPGAYSITGRAS
jgi:hypothetical protein